VDRLFKTIRRPIGIILPLEEVKRRVICDALDKCGGNYLLAAHLLGIGKTTVYRMAREYNYQSPKAQGEALMAFPPTSPSQGSQPRPGAATRAAVRAG
jgi:hypothetical protein